MKTKSSTLGIVSYGTYIPAHVISSKEIEKAQGKIGSGVPESLGVWQKTVPSIDEDTITLSVQAATQALTRFDVDRFNIGSLFIGSESHPYAVKPSSTVVKEALGLSDTLFTSDLQFACKAGTASLQNIFGLIGSGMCMYGLAIGADTAQSKPGDVLEFTAGCGAAAFVVGTDHVIARLLATTSIISDTPDFWRRPNQEYPQHASRFSGEPGYFDHTIRATQAILAQTGLTPHDIDWCVFHTPNAKFPTSVASQLGFTQHQLQYSLIVRTIGNTYAAASLLTLANVLDHAHAHEKILVVSYGSGAGSDAFLFETTPTLVKKRKQWTNNVETLIQRLTSISYTQYRQYTYKEQ